MNSNKFRKAFKYGAASTAFTAIFIVGVILLNVIAGLVGQAVDLNIDLTPNSIYQISDDTYQLLDAMEEEVDIYIFKSEADMDAVALQYLKEYDLYSDKISLKTVDINVNPAFAKDYGVKNTDQILFKSDIRNQAVNVKDIYYENAYTGSSGVCAEYVFSSAIKFVTADKIPTMAVITGHNELTDGNEFNSVSSIAKDNCYNIVEVDLRYNEIPEDATYLTIVGPSLDFTLEEIDKLDLFMERKAENVYTIGIYLLYSAPNLPNLLGFLDEWGITANYQMVFETTNYMSKPYQVNAEMGKSVFTENLAGTIATPTTIHFTTRYVNGFNSETTDKLPVKVLTTTKNAYVRDINLVDFEDEDDEPAGDVTLGRYNTAVMSTKAASAGNRVVDYNLLVFGSPYVVHDNYLTSASFINSEVLAKCYETSATDDTSFYVSPKYYVDSTLAIGTMTERNVYITILSAIVAALLCAGVVVYIRRKNR